MKHIHTQAIPRAASVGINQTPTRPYKKRDDATAGPAIRDLQRHAEWLCDALAMVATAFEDTPASQLTQDQRAALYQPANAEVK